MRLPLSMAWWTGVLFSLSRAWKTNSLRKLSSSLEIMSSKTRWDPFRAATWTGVFLILSTTLTKKPSESLSSFSKWEELQTALNISTLSSSAIICSTVQFRMPRTRRLTWCSRNAKTRARFALRTAMCSGGSWALLQTPSLALLFRSKCTASMHPFCTATCKAVLPSWSTAFMSMLWSRRYCTTAT